MEPLVTSRALIHHVPTHSFCILQIVLGHSSLFSGHVVTLTGTSLIIALLLELRDMILEMQSGSQLSAVHSILHINLVWRKWLTKNQF